MRRLIAVVAAAALGAASLAGCVQNLPDPARDWLAGQPGVISAEVLSDHTGAWSSSGLVRGELEPDITDAALTALIGAVRDHEQQTGGVGYWLGIDQVDLAVGDDAAGAVALWRSLRGVDGVRSGIVLDGDVRARTLRADAPAVLDSVLQIPGAVRLEAFADAGAADADRASDIEKDAPNTSAFEFVRPDGCQPSAPVLALAADLVSRDEFPGATADLCSGFTLDVPVEAPFASTAVSVRRDLDDRGLGDFPVQLTADDGSGTVHFAAVSPGDAALLRVLEVFEGDGVPPGLSYSLAPDGTLAITGYAVPTADLVTLVQKAPRASALVGIGLEGDPVSIAGTLGQLPRLLDEALALDQASDAFGSVTLGQGFGTVYLDAQGTNTPDAARAAADLRASGATDRRYFTVIYGSFQADIVNGVAALHDSGYVGADVMVAFVDAWNAG
ncbi:MAG: hypothetical protein ACTHKX_01215 [Pseudolysinimonas sp.]